MSFFDCADDYRRDCIERALNGFSLALVAGWDMPRLITAILEASILEDPFMANGSTPQGNADARDELQKLAKQADKLRQGIYRLGGSAGMALFLEAEEHAALVHGMGQFDQKNDFNPMVMQPLALICDLLARSASQLATERPQPPRWRDSAMADRRVGFAVRMTPVFEAAFQRRTSAHTWGADYDKTHPWPDFYARLYGAFNDDADCPNLREILEQAAIEYPRLQHFMAMQSEQAATRLGNNLE